jgi:hypothetical protein
MSQNTDEIAIQTRFKSPDFELIENWRRSQRKIPSLSETVRMLVKLGLQSEERTA